MSVSAPSAALADALSTAGCLMARADLDRSLSECGLTATAVDDYIAQVLPRGLDGIAAAAGVNPETAGRNAASA